MADLLHADMRRMFRSGIFRLAAAVMFVFAVICFVDGISEARLGEYEPFLDDKYYTAAVFVYLPIAVFDALFLGTEYSDGTIRNKTAVGHRRFEVYLSELLTLAAASVVFLAVWYLTYGVLGSLFFETAGYTWTRRLRLMLMSVVMAAALAALLTFIGMLCSNKAASAVVCLLTSLALLFSGALAESALSEPEIFPSYVMITEDGTVTEISDAPNPNYVTEPARTVLQLFCDCTPGGQAMELQTEERLEKTGGFLLADLVWICVFTGAGIAIFRKKDIR